MRLNSFQARNTPVAMLQLVFVQKGCYSIRYMYKYIWHELFSSIWVALSVNSVPLQWRFNGRDGVSNLRIIGLYEGNSPVTGGFPHKGPVTLKMLPFDVCPFIRESQRIRRSGFAKITGSIPPSGHGPLHFRVKSILKIHRAYIQRV